MDVDDDDDFYAPAEDVPEANHQHEQQAANQTEVKSERPDEDLEEGEEEDEGEDDGSDSEIDIITERKDGGSKAAPPSQARYNDIRNIPQRTASNDVLPAKSSIKKEGSGPKGTTTPVSSVDLPAVATSKIDIDAKPIYSPAGKAITAVSIDDDLPSHDKSWRRPGTDISDYFNYGFDEFTWALYATKQESLRAEYDQDKIALNNKKMMEDMNMMMAMGGMPSMPGLAAGGGAGAGGGAAAAAAAAAGMAMPSMPGLEGIPPEMQAMMQQMMAAGIDPSQMDPATMFASMAGAQGGGGGGTGQGAGQGGNQNQGFGGGGAQQGFGQAGNQQQQQMGYGYDQGGMMNGGSNRGNFRGRGRGHRNW